MLGNDSMYYPMMALAFGSGMVLAVWRARQIGLSHWKVLGVCAASLLGGIVGARIGYLFLDWGYYRSHPAEIPQFWLGGMVFYTGFALGMLAAAAVIRWARLPFWKTVDLIIPPGAFGLAIGRIGCLLTGCCAGSPTGLPWGVAFPPETIRRHPTQVYESLGMLGLFFLLKRLERRSPPEGTVLHAAFLYYGIMRFMLEWIREDTRAAPLDFSMAQWISLGLMIWGTAGLMRRWRASGPV